MYIHKTSAFTFHFNQQTTFSQFMVTDHIQACHIGPRSALGIICLNLNLFRFFGIFLGHHFPNIFLFARKRFNKLFSQCLQYVAYFYLAENGQIKNLLFFIWPIWVHSRLFICPSYITLFVLGAP